MNVYLMAPHELPATQIQLPVPKLGDTVNSASTLTIRNSMNGTMYSYVKQNDSVQFTWELQLYYQKYIELREFIKLYSEVRMRVIDWRENVYAAYLVNLPIAFSTINIGEYKQVTLQFEGVLL